MTSYCADEKVYFCSVSVLCNDMRCGVSIMCFMTFHVVKVFMNAYPAQPTTLWGQIKVKLNSAVPVYWLHLVPMQVTVKHSVRYC